MYNILMKEKVDVKMSWVNRILLGLSSGWRERGKEKKGNKPNGRKNKKEKGEKERNKRKREKTIPTTRSHACLPTHIRINISTLIK